MNDYIVRFDNDRDKNPFGKRGMFCCRVRITYLVLCFSRMSLFARKHRVVYFILLGNNTKKDCVLGEKMITIETKRLTIRSLTENDAKAVSFNSRQPSVAHFLSDMILSNTKAAKEWIALVGDRSNTVEPFQALAIESRENSIVVGLVGIAPKKELQNEVEIIYLISDEYQNRGYATEAVKAVIWWSFEEIELEFLSAIIKPDNTASKKVVEKLGFAYIDTRKLLYDNEDCEFLYYRLYHTDILPKPE